jgi:drug/metabolite transporter (DMT)-like permease
MKLKGIAVLAFLFNTALFATYYAVSKEALERIDPIVFTFFEMTSLVPIALCILAFSWKHVTRVVVRRGIVLGSTLCLALFTIAIALKYTTATSTAFFPALNGFLAALIAWLFLKQPLTKMTWGAGLFSIVGAALLIMNSPMGGIRGSLIAFLGGLFFTCYVFLSDTEQEQEAAPWPLFAIELLTMAGWACLVSLLFGDWKAFHPSLPKDVYVILYVAGACTFLPTMITALMQKHISALTVSFIYVLEPVLGAFIANLYLHELLPLYGYIGGSLVVIGAIIQTCTGIKRTHTQEQYGYESKQQLLGWETGRPQGDASPIHVSVPNASSYGRGIPSRVHLLSGVIYPLLFLFGGGFLLAKIGGLPPTSWQELFLMRTQLLASSALWRELATQLLLVQAICWLVAWLSVILTGSLGIARSLALRNEAAHIAEQETLQQQAIPRAAAMQSAVVQQSYAEQDLVTAENVLQQTFSGDFVTARREVRITEELPLQPEIHVWEEYPEMELAVAAYEVPTVPPVSRQNEDTLQEQRQKMRRMRLARV